MGFLKKAGAFILLFYVLLSGLDWLFTYVYKQGSYYKTQWLFNIHDQEFDYAILGSSRPYTSIDTRQVNNETSQKGINISLDGSTTPTHSLSLKMFLERGNKIKRLYLNEDHLEIHSQEVGKFSYPRFFPFYREKLVRDHYSKFGLKWKLYYYIPFIRYAEQNTAWGLHQFANSLTHMKKPKFDAYGTKIYPHTDYRDSRELREYVYDTTGFMGYFDDIISTCHENNIDLIVFTCPYANLKADSSYYKGVEKLDQYLQNRNAKYYDFGDRYNLQFDLFVDRDHLNKYGVKLFSTDVSQMILKTSD